jgi:hypothetical protein
MQGRVVRVAKLPEKKRHPITADDLAAEVAYYYQQYSFIQAKRLPLRRTLKLLATARRLRAQHYLELAQIAAAPHTEGGEGYQALIKRYKEEANSG